MRCFLFLSVVASGIYQDSLGLSSSLSHVSVAFVELKFAGVTESSLYAVDNIRRITEWIENNERVEDIYGPILELAMSAAESLAELHDIVPKYVWLPTLYKFRHAVLSALRHWIGYCSNLCRSHPHPNCYEAKRSLWFAQLDAVSFRLKELGMDFYWSGSTDDHRTRQIASVIEKLRSLFYKQTEKLYDAAQDLRTNFVPGWRSPFLFSAFHVLKKFGKKHLTRPLDAAIEFQEWVIDVEIMRADLDHLAEQVGETISDLGSDGEGVTG